MAKNQQAQANTDQPADAVPPDYREIVKALVDMHALEEKVAKGGNNYDAMREVRREGGNLWKIARESIYGPPQDVDNKPKSAAEQKRWDERAKRAAARRGTSTEQSDPA
jgi:hypothetical protein